MQNNNSQERLERRIRKGILPFRVPEQNKKITGRRIETNEFMFTNGGESFNSNKFPVLVTLNKSRSRKGSEGHKDNKYDKESFSYKKNGRSTHIEVERSYSTRMERAKIKILNDEPQYSFKNTMDRSNKKETDKSRSSVLKNLKFIATKKDKVVKFDKSVQADETHLDKLKAKILKKLKNERVEKKNHKRVISDTRTKKINVKEDNHHKYKDESVIKAERDTKTTKKGSVTKNQKVSSQDISKRTRIRNQIALNVKVNFIKKEAPVKEKIKISHAIDEDPVKEVKKCRIEINENHTKSKAYIKNAKSKQIVSDLKNKNLHSKNNTVCDSTLRKMDLSKDMEKNHINIQDNEKKLKKFNSTSKLMRKSFKFKRNTEKSFDFNSVFKILIKELYSNEKNLKDNINCEIDEKVFTDLELLLNTRKKALTATFKQMSSKLDSENNKQDLMKWYYQEILFIQQIKLCLKLKRRTSVNKTKTDQISNLRANLSNLKAKKISSHIDLSFSNDLLVRRRSSHLISDPDVVNIKAEYLGHTKKNINRSEIDIPICISLKSEVSVNEKSSSFFLTKATEQISLFNSLCDNVIIDMVNDEVKTVLADILSAITVHRNTVINQKRINTTIEGLVNDVKDLFNFVIGNFSDAIIISLNKPYGYNNANLLELLNSKEDAELSLYSEYTNRPVITVDIKAAIQARSPSTKSYITIYKNLLLDCLNEALCTWRPFVYKYEPFPWQLVTGNTSRSLIETKDLQAVADLTLIKIKEWGMLVCGYLNDKEDSYMGAMPIADMGVLESVKEDRLMKYINWEVYENEDRWISYDLEFLESAIVVENKIWDDLLNDLVNNFL